MRILLAAVLLGFVGVGYAVESSRYAITLRDVPPALAREELTRLADRYGVALSFERGTAIVETTDAVARILSIDPRVAALVRLHATPNAVEVWSSGTYSYDGDGNIKAIGSNTYIYDAQGRLVSGTVAGGTKTQQYDYDAFGNVTEMRTLVGSMTTNVRTFDVDPKTNRIRTADGSGSGGQSGNVVAVYDAAGNEASLNAGSTRRFDPLSIMTSAGGDAFYIYTAADERIASSNLNGSYRRWTLRGADQKILREFVETVVSGQRRWTWDRDYVYRDGLLLGGYRNDADTHRTMYHYHVDHLGSPRLVTDKRGVRVVEEETFPFGEDAAFTINDGERLHFGGHERDYNDGTAVENTRYLDYMHGRYYAPTGGRFVSVDPLLNTRLAVAQPQAWNRYSYVLNKPMTLLDPTGRVVELPANCASGTTVCKDLQDLRNSVPPEARIYVQAMKTKDGSVVLNANLLNAGSQSTRSDNFLALRQLANSPKVVQFTSTARGFSMNFEGKRESFVFAPPTPDATIYGQMIPSADSLNGKAQVFVNPFLSPAARSANIGHELYGHMRRYILGLPYEHSRQTVWDESFQGFRPATTETELAIQRADREAAQNATRP